MKSYALILASAVLLGGCASQPNVYYTLTAPLNEQVQAVVPDRVGPYTLASVSVPPQVDDSMLVVRRSGDVLMKLAHDRWSAPLGKQIDNALAVQLTQLLGAPPLSRSQVGGARAQVSQITVDVQRFDMVAAQYAALSAVWQVSAAPGVAAPRNLVCYTELQEPVSPGVAPLVQAQQLNVSRLALAISQAWQAGVTESHTRCQ